MRDEIENKLLSFEKYLHNSTVRKNRDEMGRYLHKDFKEIGRSGRVYGKKEVLDELSNEAEFTKIVSENYEFVHLDELTILITYKTAHLGEQGQLSRFTLRSSLWKLNGDKWQMIFHQGTPTTET